MKGPGSELWGNFKPKKRTAPWEKVLGCGIEKKGR